MYHSFIKKSDTVISWYFLSQLFEEIKELLKALFPILININIESYTILIT